MRRLAGWLWLAVVVAACNAAQSAPRPVSIGSEIVAAPATDTTSAQQDAVVAYDGTNYLVAWSESRGATTGSDIVAVLVAPTGALVGSPFVVSGAAGDQLQPSVAFDGTRYLVVWLDQRVGGDKEIYGARVSTSGQVLDPSGVDLSRRDGHQVAPVVGF